MYIFPVPLAKKGSEDGGYCTLKCNGQIKLFNWMSAIPRLLLLL